MADALWWAAEYGHASIVERLFHYKVDPNLAGEAGEHRGLIKFIDIFFGCPFVSLSFSHSLSPSLSLSRALSLSLSVSLSLSLSLSGLQVVSVVL